MIKYYLRGPQINMCWIHTFCIISCNSFLKGHGVMCYIISCWSKWAQLYFAFSSRWKEMDYHRQLVKRKERGRRYVFYWTDTFKAPKSECFHLLCALGQCFLLKTYSFCSFCIRGMCSLSNKTTSKNQERKLKTP